MGGVILSWLAQRALLFKKVSKGSKKWGKNGSRGETSEEYLTSFFFFFCLFSVQVETIEGDAADRKASVRSVV